MLLLGQGVTDLKQVAGGGLLERRAFLLSGIGLSLAGFADKSARKRRRWWRPLMTCRPGCVCLVGRIWLYGLPAAQEQVLQRQHAGPPEDSGLRCGVRRWRASRA